MSLAFPQFKAWHSFAGSIHSRRRELRHTSGRKDTTLLALVEAEVSASVDPLHSILFDTLTEAESLQGLAAMLEDRDALLTPEPLQHVDV
eukprot:342188-Prymnesium_polylepis.1